MTTWNEYLKGVFEKILQSYYIISQLNDKPGDLATVEKELLKITGFFHVVVRKLDSENFQSKTLSELKSKLHEYLDTYYFEEEIKTMAMLYSDDTNRIHNIRLKILESFDDKKLMDKIQSSIEEL
ncbi:MAG: hypothetical protein COW27_01720 [Nitrosopumilales archaeon CG15_BIG_FIL_POST_REV_8_21_14_020_37_12]|nr:MAG: hypothetical protein COW27_01720 [Nitrosopumilales archaeon CG15_BIG_FIL_POST_REV_8_21_14_020_37_12]